MIVRFSFKIRAPWIRSLNKMLYLKIKEALSSAVTLKNCGKNWQHKYRLKGGSMTIAISIWLYDKKYVWSVWRANAWSRNAGIRLVKLIRKKIRYQSIQIERFVLIQRKPLPVVKTSSTDILVNVCLVTWSFLPIQGTNYSRST